LNNHYLGLVSQDVQAVIQDVEEACGFEIDVETDEERVTLACRINPTSAAVIVPGEDLFKDAAVWHEIMHIKRILVDGEPRLEVGDGMVWNDAFRAGLENLDNTIEHFYIVPEELQRYPNRLARWQQRVLLQVQGLAGNHLPALEKDIGVRILYALDVIGINNAALTASVEAAVQLHSTMAMATRLVNGVRAVLGDKAEVARVIVREFGFADDSVTLEYLNPASGQTTHEPLFEAH
jgi:hypothetical protein